MLKPLFATISMLVIMDSVTKILVRTTLLPGQSVNLIGEIVKITFVQNYSGFSWWVPTLPVWAKGLHQAILIILAVMAYPVYIFYKQTRQDNVWAKLAFVFIVSASLSHILGDIGQAYTTDFIQVLNSPSANLADIYSYTGIGSLIIVIYRGIRTRDYREIGIRNILAGMKATRKEFIQFMKSGIKRKEEK